ncbi:MAG: uroporphyrinogen-III decarboxylase-like protein [candidate division KSB1 bacterium]|nr:uroporphyrinogen-III decarboxylase-like protein [candidate division KSB1 bacterium]
MRKETMTPRERWLAVLRREKPDRVPMDYWATPEVTQNLMRHLGCSNEQELFAALHIDAVVHLKPRYVGPQLPTDTDPFGCRFRELDYGSGRYRECVHHPLAAFTSVHEIQRHYTWPQPDWWDYSEIRDQAREHERWPLAGGLYEPFLTYKYLRGDEQAFVDLVENPEMVHYCLDQLLELSYQETLRIYEQVPGQVTYTYVAEDMGGQTDLLFSPAVIREFFLPRMKKMIDLAHQAGVYVFHHNDGAIRRIIPDMIEAGIDILNPLQWRTPGMEREGLKRDFGGKVVLHGGVDNQYTLPFGTVEQVRQEVLDNLRILGQGGGYILAPCHNIQPITPPENVVVMYQTGLEFGWQ